jgi:hypothetical protein
MMHEHSLISKPASGRFRISILRQTNKFNSDRK